MGKETNNVTINNYFAAEIWLRFYRQRLTWFGFVRPLIALVRDYFVLCSQLCALRL